MSQVGAANSTYSRDSFSEVFRLLFKPLVGSVLVFDVSLAFRNIKN